MTLFLAILMLLDSYKLVRLRRVVSMLGAGVGAALCAYALHAAILAVLPFEPAIFSRYVAPLTEELLKASMIVLLVRSHRIAFLVDAAIVGFAVGTGFALVENLYYLRTLMDAGMGIWIVRGFGTSFMHGGATALFAVTCLAIAEKRGLGIAAVAPGFAMAALLHSAFNHFFASPIVSTIGIVIALPILFGLVFERSESAVADWLGTGFDADAQMLQLIESGELSNAPVGQYLHELRDRFKGPILADLLCYLKLHTELALRAKGVLMMRESGFDVAIDDETRAKFTEMQYLEGSIGRTGLLAIHPMLPRTSKDIWQLYLLRN